MKKGNESFKQRILISFLYFGLNKFPNYVRLNLAKNIRSIAQVSFKMKPQAILKTLVNFFYDEDFDSCVCSRILLKKVGLFVTGVGKSSKFGHKIVGDTEFYRNSSTFLCHAADAIHGDFGRSNPKMWYPLVFLRVGILPELKSLVPLLKKSGLPVLVWLGQQPRYVT